LIFGTYINASRKKILLKADDIHPDPAYILQKEKCCQHSFNCMALGLRSVKCQYFLFYLQKKTVVYNVLVLFVFFIQTIHVRVT